jgi:hypothetical protein
MATAIPLPTGESVTFILSRRTKRGPSETRLRDKLDELRRISPAVLDRRATAA